MSTADTFNISDEKEEGDEVEEEEEEETEPEEEEEVGTAEHKRARGDNVDPEEEEEEPATAEELEEIATGGGRSARARISQLTAERDRAISAALKLAEKQAEQAAAPAAKKEEPPAYDFAGKRKEIATMRREANKLLLEGEEDKAGEIQDRMDAAQDEITAKLQEQAETRAEQRAAVRVAAALEEDRAASAIAEGFEKYPFLSDTNKDVEHNKEALADVIMYRNRYANEGMSLSAALRKAIAKVGPMYAEEGADEKPSKPKKRPAEEDDEDDNARASVNKTILKRIRERRLANAKIEKHQPPQTGKLGTAHRERLDVTQLDVEGMTDKEFDELPEDIKKQLRGDRVSA
jgi:hypothetical protein